MKTAPDLIQAQKIVLDRIHGLEPESKTLLKALGQNVVENIISAMDVPAWDASALDGFAVKSTDIASASYNAPALLKVSGTLSAGGSGHPVVNQGEAVRIMTGAPVPSGADCVVGFEDTSVDLKKSAKARSNVSIYTSLRKGQNIRTTGHQIKQGTLLLERGQEITASNLGLLASVGIESVLVIKKPTVAIISTGAELTVPGHPLAWSKIYAGTQYDLAARIIRCGGIPRLLGIARDNKNSIRKKIERAASCDLVITTGGSSRGDKDLIKPVMSEMGRILLDEIAVAPGKSTALGLLKLNGRSILHFALSGSPTASLLLFETLVRPAILKLKGQVCGWTDTLPAAMPDIADNPGRKTRLLWITLDHSIEGLKAVESNSKTAGIFNSIAAANGIALIPAGYKSTGRNSVVRIIPV